MKDKYKVQAKRRKSSFVANSKEKVTQYTDRKADVHFWGFRIRVLASQEISERYQVASMYSK